MGLTESHFNSETDSKRREKRSFDELEVRSGDTGDSISDELREGKL